MRRRLSYIARGPKVRVKAKDADGLAHALDTLGIRLRLNTRSHRHQFQRDGKDWQDFDDYNAGTMRRQINQRFIYETKHGISPLKFGRDSWAEYTLSRCTTITVLTRFKNGSKLCQSHDGKPRLDGWLKCVLHHSGRIGHAGDVGRPVLTAMGSIARTYTAGPQT